MQNNKNHTMIENIPTSLITGFLGVGKTSAILHLMSQKPDDEKWSVLVNEFGAIGIDSAIYQSKGIDVKEIPGGCMCCAAGLPLQVAVNRILKETKPHRLLIEPSGLGHPKRVLDTLQGEHFQKVLAMRASICLIDPRNLSDTRYTSHENFIDQIAMADILVANKTDLCDAETIQRFYDYAQSLQPKKQEVLITEFGQLDSQLLDLKPEAKRHAKYPHHHANDQPTSTESLEKDGYKSVSLRYSQEIIFDVEKLTVLLSQINEERVKGVMHTNQGWKVFNIQGQQIEINAVKSYHDSRVEIIGQMADAQAFKDKLDDHLKTCLSSEITGRE